MATRLPSVIETAAASARTPASCPPEGSISAPSRASPATAATFDAVATNAATPWLAPSYTSGAQKWNGNSASLNRKPAEKIAPPTSATGPPPSPGRPGHPPQAAGRRHQEEVQLAARVFALARAVPRQEHGHRQPGGHRDLDE